MLLVLAGKIRFRWSLALILGLIGLIPATMIWAELALAMRLARQDRERLSSFELTKENALPIQLTATN